jgi:DNA phosphorothioation-associated putative methyltransferase
MDGDHSWTLHTDYINQLPPVLRTYIGCATQLYGDLYEVDLIKIHMQSNKISLMKYDDFENKPLPLLMERIKINLRDQQIDFYTYGEKFKPQPLYLKSKFLDNGFPNFELQVTFDEQLKSMELIDLKGFGPSIDEFEEILLNNNFVISCFKLKKIESIS